DEAPLERVGTEGGEDPAEGVVAGHAGGQVEERAEPGELALGEHLDLGPAAGAADHAAHGQDDDVVQLVNHVDGPRVGQAQKVAQHTPGRLDVHAQAPRAWNWIVENTRGPANEEVSYSIRPKRATRTSAELVDALTSHAIALDARVTVSREAMPRSCCWRSRSRDI